MEKIKIALASDSFPSDLSEDERQEFVELLKIELSRQYTVGDISIENIYCDKVYSDDEHDHTEHVTEIIRSVWEEFIRG